MHVTDHLKGRLYVDIMNQEIFDDDIDGEDDEEDAEE